MKREWNRPVAEALNKWLEDVHNMRRVSRLAGIGTSTLYDWLSERYPIPAWAPARIFNVVPDIGALVKTLGLDELGLTVSRVPNAKSTDDLRDAALRVAGDAGLLARVVADALQDGRIDDDERRALDRAAEQVQRVAEELRQAARIPTLKAVTK